MRNYWIQEGLEHCRNKDGADISKTKRNYANQSRYLNESLFQCIMPNKEDRLRQRLIYSPSTNCLYCFCCHLLSDDRTNQFASSGFNDWKNTISIAKHENSEKHRSALVALFTLQNVACRIDKEIEQQYQTQVKYWVEVIQRIVVAISFLAERGLGFRGSDERFNSVHNGNYLGLSEVIAKFDPFPSHHIKEKGNLGSGNTSYLSKTIAEEFIDIMGKKLLDTIISEINLARYFSISVDSTPDIAHLDQLTIVLRYVNFSTHEPVERFMKFIQIVGHHTGDNLAEILLNFLNLNGVNIEHCRVQTYDNASNMSGKYPGMQKAYQRCHSSSTLYTMCRTFFEFGWTICS